jgi:Fic family protein
VLRYKEKVDIEACFTEAEDSVIEWRSRLTETSPALRNEFQNRLVISLIYHDAALEGDVLTYSEIKAAIDPTIISDTSLIPSYESIKRYYDAFKFAEEFAAGRKRAFKLDTLREIYSMLSPEAVAEGLPYRQDNPLHRLYYHDIAQPDAIDKGMTDFGKWLDSNETRHLHPVERAAETHHRIMAIFPWAKESGRCARIVSNLLLRQADFPIAVIHSIDRQRYYESLRGESDQLLQMYLEAVQTAAVSEIRVYEEAERAPRRRRRRAWRLDIDCLSPGQRGCH